MSKANRKFMYDKLVKENKLSQDDGSLVKEFGTPLPVAKPKEEKPKGAK